MARWQTSQTCERTFSEAWKPTRNSTFVSRTCSGASTASCSSTPITREHVRQNSWNCLRGGKCCELWRTIVPRRPPYTSRRLAGGVHNRGGCPTHSRYVRLSGFRHNHTASGSQSALNYVGTLVG